MPSEQTGHTSMPVRFIVLSTQRSGSTWLLDLLNSNPAIMTFNEMFINAPYNSAYENCKYTAEYTYYEYRRTFAGMRPWIVFKYMNHLAAQGQARGAVGFKLMYNHAEHFPEILWQALRDRYRIIHLVRPNHFNRIISQKFHQVSGVKHSDRPVEQETIRLDPESIVWKLKKKDWQMRGVRTALKLLPLPTMELDYTDLRTDPAGEMARVWTFLGVEAHRVESSFKKLVRKKHPRLIRNYNEIEEALSGTQYEHMLER